jgi:ribosomal protein L37AE/L43A
MGEIKNCVSCGRRLLNQHGVWLCPSCNSRDLDTSRVFMEAPGDDEYVFIECPGATLYESGTTNVIAGVKFHDDNDPFKGHRIIGHPVYAPNHCRRRRIRREALGKIRRCQACQDYTVRMRRREGADFYIPSSKHPGREKLKSVTPLTYEP